MDSEQPKGKRADDALLPERLEAQESEGLYGRPENDDFFD